MVRFEKDKLIIEVDCAHLKPEEELVSLQEDLLVVLRSQDKDFFVTNKYTVDHLLDFLTELLPSSDQFKTENNLQA